MKRYLKKGLGFVLVLALALSLAGTAFAADLMNPPVVDVAGGQLKGYVNGDTYAFAGVQYATAERFELPKPVEPWEGVKSAQSYGTICPIPAQTSVGADEFVWPHRYWPQNENCQFLNIWTQQLDTAAKKPVMVFLHGGGYTNGSSIESWAYDGKNLSEYGDVVVVTLNHRLNVLGFFDLSAYGEEYAGTANMGMADIVEALKWVQDNIASFGGDPDNVTIFGQSGGGGKVLALMRMPSAEGLFKRGIVESGGAAFMNSEVSQKIAKYTFAELGIEEGDVEALKNVDYTMLVTAGQAALTKLGQEPEMAGTNVRWSPTADGVQLTEALQPWTADMPLMVGTVFSEQSSTFQIGDGRKNEWTEEEITANLSERYGANSDAIAAEFQNLFPDKKVQDAYFYAPTNRATAKTTMDLKSASGTGSVYNYLFAYEAPVNGGTSAFHCVELIYAFHNVDIPIISIATGGNEDAHRIQDQVAGAWVNFAATGNPGQEGLEWAPYTAENNSTMVFDIASSCKALDDANLIALMTAK